MIDSEVMIKKALDVVEQITVETFKLKYEDTVKPPVIDIFKASMMSEIARRLHDRANKIEEDWLHFTRE